MNAILPTLSRRPSGPHPRAFPWRRPAVILAAVSLLAGASRAGTLTLPNDTYGHGGLFTDPLIATTGASVRIGVRATADGTVPAEVSASVTVTHPDGRTEAFRLTLRPEADPPEDLPGAHVAGAVVWTAGSNGLYRVQATVGEGNGTAPVAATLDLPVVVPGRLPRLVWYDLRECDYLRWANIAGRTVAPGSVKRFRERGRLPLQAVYLNKRAYFGADAKVRTREQALEEFTACAGKNPVSARYGLAVDELGYYPEPRAEANFRTFMAASGEFKKSHPDTFMLVWHCGTLYPGQAAAYRKNCDLVVIENYLFHYMPRDLGLEDWRQGMDVKMLAARQCDLLVPSGKGTQAIMALDLSRTSFDRGMMETVFRHLRRTWPEMRGIGFYASCAPRAHERKRNPEEADPAFAEEGRRNNLWVDRLCFEYFARPLVTLAPGQLHVHRNEDGAYAVTATIGNLGGMDSGPVTAAILVDGKTVTEQTLARVPAGDSLLRNQARITAAWRPPPGLHHIEARIVSATGANVLDATVGTDYCIAAPVSVLLAPELENGSPEAADGHATGAVLEFWR